MKDPQEKNKKFHISISYQLCECLYLPSRNGHRGNANKHVDDSQYEQEDVKLVQCSDGDKW